MRPVRAVLAVSDKRGIEGLARGLAGLGWELLATDGTQRLLAEAGVEAAPVADAAGVPTILGGRVKTLTAPLMGGILCRPDDPGDREDMRRHGLRSFGLVACNYYRLPDPASVRSLDDFRERIDVGGPAMLRAAAKNCAAVLPVCDPDDYDRVLALLQRAEGPEGVGERERLALARKAFDYSADYEAQVRALFHTVEGAP